MMGITYESAKNLVLYKNLTRKLCINFVYKNCTRCIQQMYTKCNTKCIQNVYHISRNFWIHFVYKIKRQQNFVYKITKVCQNVRYILYKIFYINFVHFNSDLQKVYIKNYAYICIQTILHTFSTFISHNTFLGSYIIYFLWVQIT